MSEHATPRIDDAGRVEALIAERDALRQQVADLGAELATLAHRFRKWDEHMRSYIPVEMGGDPDWDEKEDRLIRKVREAADLPHAKAAAERWEAER